MVNPLQVMIAALAFTEPSRYPEEYVENIKRMPMIGPTRQAEPILMRHDPGPKGNWDKCVAHRKKKLDARKRQRKARKKQRK